MTVLRSNFLLVVLILQLAGFMACTNDQPGATDTGNQVSLEGVVTGQAAAAVGTDGRFRLPAPPKGPEEEISGPRAVELAAAWGKQFARFFEKHLESERGTPIDIKNLKPCGRPLYAKGNYEPLPPEVPLIFRRVFQSYWFVALCGRAGVPEVSLAVSATSTDLTLVDGQLRFPRVSGDNFFAAGIPDYWRGGPLPYSPEDAAIEAASRTGRQVAAVPELRMPYLGETIPQGARWLITLDAGVSMRGEKRATLPPTRQFYVGVDAQHGQRPGTRGMSVPADSQPSTTDFRYPVFDSLTLRILDRVPATAVRKSGFPLRFEVVTTRVTP